MLKDTLNQLDLSTLTTTGLILFFIIFIAVTLYALTRTPGQAEQWSRIPLTFEITKDEPRRHEEQP